MAETTGISWTDATWNPWEGCTKVGPGCDNCYAENRDKRFHGGEHWGPGAARRRMTPGTFQRPLAWNYKRAAYDAAQHEGNEWGDRPTPAQWVFTLSLGDFFDNEVPPQWRADAWAVIRECTSLRWQIVTKRVGNVRKMLPEDWDDGSAYSHVGIIATTVTQDELLRDGPKLIELKDWGVRWVGLSIEPQIEFMNLFDLKEAGGLDWVICGGESKQGVDHNPRPFNLGWARSLEWQCSNLNIPFFMKQVGDAPFTADPEITKLAMSARAGANPEEWPEDLRVREMPTVYGP